MQPVAMRVAALAFLATAGAGVWADYDRSAGVRRFVLLCIGVMLIHGIEWLGRRRAATALGLISLNCAVAAGCLGALVLNSGQGEHGVVAGALVVLLPLSTGGIVWRWPNRFGISLAVGSAIGLLALLIFTEERTAFLALAGGVSAGFMVWSGWGTGKSRGGPGLARGLLAIFLIAIVGWFATQRAAPDLTDLTSGSFDSFRSRWLLWQDTLVLIGDSPFTGNGLTAFPMVYATYLVMSHVPIHAHAHNLFLQIAVEQGVPGLVAFCTMVGASGWLLMQGRAASDAPWLQATAVTALVAMLLHGLLDSELYASGFAPLAFVPIGFALAARDLDQGQAAKRVLAPARHRRVSVAAGTFALASLVIMGWGLAGTKLQAAWYANLGVISQTRAEMAVYKWPEWPIQDEVRRSGAASLTQAVRYYETALIFDPSNVTAHRRLGQIDLSLGKYTEARDHLEQAFGQGPSNRVTRELLGEAYAVTGQVTEAAALWASPGRDLNRVELRHWWYGFIGAEQEAEWVNEAAAVADALYNKN